MDTPISSRELAKLLGLSPKTLSRWVARGLIPAPTIGVHRNGRGRTSYWPQFVIGRCRRILELQRSSYSLSAVAAVLDLIPNDKQNDSSTSPEPDVAALINNPPPSDHDGHVIALFPNYAPRYGGGETHLYQLARELAANHFIVTILTRKQKGAPNALSCERHGNVSICRLGNLTSIGECRGYDHVRSIFSAVPRGLPLVLYLALSVGKEYKTEWMIRIAAAARERGIPTVLRIPSSGRVRELALISAAAIQELQRTTRIICLNPGIRRELIEVACVAPERLIEIPNGVNIDMFRPPLPGEMAEVRQACGCSNEAVILICASRFAEKKKIPKLLELWQRLSDPDVQMMPAQIALWIVGDSTFGGKPLIQRKLHTPAFWQINGRHHVEMPRFYRGADAYISLSTQEGMSNAMLEAMASGLPVVAPAVDAVSQVIKDERGGFLFPPGDDAAAFESIRRCLRTPRERLREMGIFNRKRVCESYRLDQMAERFANLFRTLLSDSRVGQEPHPAEGD